MDEVEDVYRFQELDGSEENNGASLDRAYNMVSNVSNGKQPFNPDELYFNDMDLRAWEQRSAELDGLSYGDDYGYGYLEDEGYYEEVGDMMPHAEYEELSFQRTLDKIRYARATGEADVSLTPEELEIYQSRLWGQRLPAGRPQARARPFSAPMIHSNAGTATITSSNKTGGAGSSNPRKKNQRRTSLFGGKAKKDKVGNRARTNSNATESTIHQDQGPPGFRIPGPNGQPIFTPINGYQGYNSHDARAHQPGSPLRPNSRHSSSGNEKFGPTKGKNARGSRAPRQAPLPRITTSGDMPGAFPSSPVSLRMPSPQTVRPGSSSSRTSAHDHADIHGSSSGRSRSSTLQQPPKLVPFPVTEFKHHDAEPYQYQSAGHLAQSPTQSQYARRVVSAEAPYAAMPRRLPVLVQHNGTQGIQGSHSDPAISHVGHMADVDEESDSRAPVTGNDTGSSAQFDKNTSAQGPGSGSKDSERRRKSGRSRRKK